MLERWRPFTDPLRVGLVFRMEEVVKLLETNMGENTEDNVSTDYN